MTHLLDTRTVPLELPEPFDLRLLVEAHGWIQLEPFRWDGEPGRLSHVAPVRAGIVCGWEVEEDTPRSLRLSLRSDATLAEADVRDVIAAARWSLRLEESFAPFYALCGEHAALRAVAHDRRGRMLRSPTVWEDVAKTLCTTCTTWGRTRHMIAALCRQWGAPGPIDGRPAFPEPAAIAGASVEDLRRVAGLGYRARYLWSLAAAVLDGAADLEALRGDTRPTEQLRRTLLGLPGIGPYAAANLLMLLGRYDYLAMDTWVRRIVSKGWFDGRSVSDAEIEAAFEPFGPWKALVYWFWDWDGAADV